MRHFGCSLDQKLNLPQIEVESQPSADLITKNLKSDCLLTFFVINVYVYSYYKNYTGSRSELWKDHFFEIVKNVYVFCRSPVPTYLEIVMLWNSMYVIP